MKWLKGIFNLISILFIYSLISTCLFHPALSALFEDEGKEEETKTKTKTKATETSNGANAELKLGKEVMEKVNKSYYRLWRTTISLDASYIVEKDAEKAGNLTVHWEDGKKTRTKFDGDLGQEDINALLNIQIAEVFEEALFRDYQTERKTAKKSGDNFIIKDTSTGGKNADEVHHLVVSKDYKLIQNVIKNPEGDNETNYQVETQDGEHYVKSIEWKTNGPEGDLVSKYDLTYKREKGRAIISKINVDITFTAPGFEGDEVEEYKFSLKLDPAKKVALKDPPTETAGKEIEIEGGDEIEVAGGEGELPAGWDELTKQVIPALYEATLDTSAMIRLVKKASCTITAYITPPGSSTSAVVLSYAWEDADGDGRLTADEINVETKSASDTIGKTSAPALREQIENELLNEGLNAMMGAVVKTRKTPEGYTMVIESGNAGIQSISANISNDYRTTKSRIRIKPPKGGTIDTVSEFTYKKVEDKWLKTGSKETTTASGKEVVTTMSYKYDTSTGAPLPVSITARTSTSVLATNVETVSTFNMSKWKIVKRETPISVTEFLTGMPAGDEIDIGVEVEEEDAGTLSRNKQAMAWCAKAMAEGKGKDYYKAIEYFSKGIQLDPKMAQAYFGRGMAYAETNDADKALADINKAIELEKNNANYYGMRALVYAKKRDKEKAMRDIEKAFQINKKCAPAYHARAMVYIDDGEYDLAIGDLEKAKSYGWPITDEMIQRIRKRQEGYDELDEIINEIGEKMRKEKIKEDD